MSHYCICPKCNIKFDRDKEQAVKVSTRRYGHASCYPDNKNFIPLEEKIENNEDYKKLMEYIEKLFGKQTNYALVKKQIKEYTEGRGYSLSGILKSLVYFYDVKANSIDKSNGALGIVPFVYKDAYNYYYSLFVAQSQNEQKDVAGIVSKVKEITIPLPKITLPKRFFNLDDDTEGVDENNE